MAALDNDTHVRAPLLVLMIAAGLAACDFVGVQDARTAAACDLALGYAKRFKAEQDGPVAILSQPEFDIASRQELATFVSEHPEYRNDPELPLLLALADIRGKHVVAECGNLRSWIERSGILNDDRRIEELTRQEYWPFALLAMSMPAISEDGSTALMYAGEFTGGLAGGYKALTFEKAPNGKWVLKHEGWMGIS